MEREAALSPAVRFGNISPSRAWGLIRIHQEKAWYWYFLESELALNRRRRCLEAKTVTQLPTYHAAAPRNTPAGSRARFRLLRGLGLGGVAAAWRMVGGWSETKYPK